LTVPGGDLGALLGLMATPVFREVERALRLRRAQPLEPPSLELLRERPTALRGETDAPPRLQPPVARVEVEACTGCAQCVEACAMGALAVEETACVDEEACIGCGACIVVCPSDAITLTTT